MIGLGKAATSFVYPVHRTMPLPVAQIIASMSWAEKSGLTEFTLSIGSSQVTIRRNGPVGSPSPSVQASSPAPTLAGDAGDVIATLSGLCHLAPEPGAGRFVSVGDRVEADQTLCILEAMKMMTPVTAPHGGKVEAIFVEDGAAVDAGASLMRIT